MGCFLACFGSSKDDRKRRKKPQNRVLPRDQRNVVYEALKPGVSAKEDEVENNISSSSVADPREKLEEQLSFGARKKVTFDLSIKAYEEVSKQEIEETAVGGEAKEREKKEEGAAEAKRSQSPEAKRSQSPANSADDSATSSMGSYPSNHRYQNCSNSDSDDEYDELDGEESDLDEEDYEFSDDEEDGDEQPFGVESSESFFSLPTEPKGGGSSTLNDDKEVNSPFRAPQQQPICSNPSARDRSNYVHSVLNPVENLSQWKVVKAKPGGTPLKPLKENTNLEDLNIPISSEPSFKSSSSSWKKTSFDQSTTPPPPPPPKQEVAVDASLSNWLSSTESTPSIKTKNTSTESPISVSPESLQDRPILGALTMEEIKQLSAASSSPRKSPTWSPDDKPILGTVGSYWSHTGQTTNSSSSGSSDCVGGIPNTTSKYREDKRVNWHSTPFEARLERALTTGAAEAYSTYPTSV